MRVSGLHMGDVRRMAESTRLIVLAESMMRRDGRLRRTTIEELTAYLDSAREFTEAVFEETGRRPNMFRGYANCRRALRVIQEGTDSSMETRTRLVPLKYGIDAPASITRLE